MIGSVAELRTELSDGAGRKQLILAHSGSPYLLDAELVISRSVSLAAQTPGVVLDAHASSASPRRVVRVAAGVSVSLHNLTLTGAWTSHSSNADGGGAVLNDGTLYVYNCVLSNNQAFDGAAVLSTGMLYMIDCELWGNKAVFAGGGVLVLRGTAWFVRCVFDANHAGAGGGALVNAGVTDVKGSVIRRSTSNDGGAVFNSNRLTLQDCEVTDNEATSVGGGIMNSGPNATIKMVNGLVARNAARTQGGGVLNSKPTESVTVFEASNVKFISNQARQGAGIFNAAELIFEPFVSDR